MRLLQDDTEVGRGEPMQSVTKTENRQSKESDSRVSASEERTIGWLNIAAEAEAAQENCSLCDR